MLYFEMNAPAFMKQRLQAAFQPFVGKICGDEISVAIIAVLQNEVNSMIRERLLIPGTKIKLIDEDMGEYKVTLISPKN